jgi:TatA/E family protein of Tat protein translocase
MFGSLGVPELLLIFVVILIVFGPRRIPEIGRTLGKALGEFRKATDDIKSTIEREVRLEELKQITPAVVTPFESISRSEPWSTTPVDDTPAVTESPAGDDFAAATTPVIDDSPAVDDSLAVAEPPAADGEEAKIQAS